MQRNETYSLCQLHTKLNLSQSSLASSISNLPNALGFMGIIIDYEELQFVQWKKEVLLTISEGCIETLKVSMWLNHENPIGLRYQTKKDVLGQFIHIKHVHITSFDFTNPSELQFYGEIRPEKSSDHQLMIIIVSGASYLQYMETGKPFRVHPVMSLLPQHLTDQESQLFPLQSFDKILMTKLCGMVSTYHHCISKTIHFSPAKNPFQLFINRMLENQKLRQIRISASTRWVTSYNQQRDWYRTQKPQTTKASKT